MPKVSEVLQTSSAGQQSVCNLDVDAVVSSSSVARVEEPEGREYHRIHHQPQQVTKYAPPTEAL